jgi:hypothetical protein
MMKRVYVDFNSMMRDERERVELGRVGTWQGDRLPPLCEGEQIVLFDEEMEVLGVVEFDVAHQLWLAMPDWTTRRELVL